MFRLLRYFSMASFLAFLVVTVLLGIVYRRTAIAELIAQEESKNVVVTQTFANSLRSQLLRYLAATQGLSDGQLRDHPALTALHRQIISEMAGLPVAKIKIYDAAGITIYSTEAEQIGEDNSMNEGFAIALAGGVASELTHRDTFSSYDGVLEDQDLLSTYLPVRLGEPTSPIQGVFELYSNVTPLLQRIDSTQREIVMAVALILAVLYAILFLVVRHADGIIRRQHEEVIQAEKELRRQQRTLAALREREHLARELHDSLGQVLGFLNTQAQTVSLLWTKGQTEETQRHLHRLVEIVQEAHVNVRRQIRALQVGAKQHGDFPMLLEEYMAQFRQANELDTELVKLERWSECSIDCHVGAELLGIVQEALANVRKHAQAEHVQVILDCREQKAHVTVADDGKGFALDQAVPGDEWHFGLRMMQERAHEVGGEVEVQSAPGQGTRVNIIVPLQPDLSALGVN